MRVLIVSDVHGNDEALEKALSAEPQAQVVFCLGDGAREYEDASYLYPEREFRAVRGNCDWASNLPDSGVFEANGHRVLYLHGHVCGVKQDLTRLTAMAREQGADVVLFGHTHRPLCDCHNGVTRFNPGSLGYDGWYGVADIQRDTVQFAHRRVR